MEYKEFYQTQKDIISSIGAMNAGEKENIMNELLLRFGDVLSCYNCGEHLDVDNPVNLSIDVGVPANRIEPEVPPEVIIACKTCNYGSK
jgi:hypothetical protein